MPIDWLKIGAQGPAPQRNALSAGLSSGTDDFQGLMYSAGGAVADAVGATGVRDWMNERADLNQWESQKNGRPDLDLIEDVYDQPNKWLPYLGYQVAKQIPNIAGTVAASAVIPQAAVPAALSRGLAYAPKWLGGGALGAAEGYAAKKAALAAGRGMASDVMGGAAVNYAQGVGALYQESVAGGDENGGLAALAGGVPYGLAETLPEAMLLGRIKRGSGFSGDLLSRVGKSAITQAGTGATSELLQNEMEMGYNGSVSDEEAFSRRLNSGVAGGLVEGLLGGLGGIRGRSRPTNLLNGQDLTPPGAAPLPPITIPDPVLPPPPPPLSVEEEAAIAAKQQQETILEQNKQKWLEQRASAEEAFIEPGEDGTVSPVDAKGKRLVDAGLVKLHQDMNGMVEREVMTPENYAEAVARIRVALQEGDKSGIAAVKNDMQEAQRAFDKARAKAEADAKKAQAKAEKEQKQKAQDVQVTTQAVADNTAAAQAASPQPVVQAAAPIQQVNDLEQAANVLLGEVPIGEAPTTDTGAAPAIAAPADSATASSVPVSAGTDAQSGVSSAPVPVNAGQGAVATAATHTPVVFGKDAKGQDRKAKVSILNPQGGLVPVSSLEGASPEVTTALQATKTGKGSGDLVLIRNDSGALKAIKRSQWDILRMARGLDDEGHLTREPMTGQQIADALVAAGVVQKGSRATVTKALNELGEFGLKEIKQQVKQGNLAAKDDGVTAMEFNEDGTGQVVQATAADSVEEEVDRRRFEVMDDLSTAIRTATPDHRRMMVKAVEDQIDYTQAAADWDDIRSDGTAAFADLNDLGKLLWYAAYKSLSDKQVTAFEPYEEQQRAAEQSGIGIDNEYLQAKTKRPQESAGSIGLAQPVSGRGEGNVTAASTANDRPASKPEPKGSTGGEQGTGQPSSKPAPAVNKAAEATDVQVKRRFEYPADLGFPKKIVAGQRAVVDFMNGDLSREELIDQLATLGLREGELRSISNRMGGFTDPETGRITGSVAGQPVDKPIAVTLTNANGSTVEIKDAELEVRRLESKIQKLEALVKCLAG